MPAKRGHENYNKNADPAKNGGALGYLGKPKDSYTVAELNSLGQELLTYMNEPRSIWAKGFCNRKGFSSDHLKYLNETYPIFKEYYSRAKAIQEEKLVTHSFWREADGNFAKFMLARHHEGWQEEVKEPVQNITYHVNYGNQEQVSPKSVSTSDSECP